MVKKYLILIMLCLSMFGSVFSADEFISQCPATTQNDTRYILDPSFSFSSTPCFDLTNTNDVIIDGNNTDFMGTSFFEIDSFGDAWNAQIVNIISDDFQINIQGTQNNIELSNSYIYWGHSFAYTGISSGIPNTNSANAIILYNGNGGSGTLSNWLDIHDNRFESRQLDHSQDDNSNLIHVTSTKNGLSLNVQRNDFVGYGLVGRKLANNGGSGGQSYNLNVGFFNFADNIYLDEKRVTNYMTMDAGFSCSNYGINSNNLLSSESLTDISDNNGISDETLSISVSTCSLINTNARTTKQFNNPQFAKGTETEFGTMTPLFFGSQLFDNARYYLAKEITLDASEQWSFSAVQNSVLDLSLFRNDVAIVIEAPRTILLGNSNKIEGLPDEETTKPIIETSGTISIADGGLYSNNWNLIEYDNGAIIDGINFDLNAVDNYGLVRKRNAGTDGLNFEFTNNIFDLNFVPADADSRPFFVVGAFTKIIGNEFLLLSSENVSLFGGGLSSQISGGHVITDNTFIGGGFIFKDLSDTATNFQSKFIHNEFLKSGSLYAQPFHPTQNNQNLLDNPQLDGSYFYSTTCTNYEFNVGNYYEDWDDAGWYNDTNNDGVHDSFNGVDYIIRGTDFNGVEIRDYASVVPYPFDFASHTGNAISTTDTCQSFVFNVIEPTNFNYTSGHDTLSNWEFISIGYSAMTCFESLNGYTTIYEDVDSGENNGIEYETTDGKGTLSVRCCDNAQCDNIVKESTPVEFCVGNCALGNLIVTGAVTPTIINGCTDNLATNYNPSANTDDGSCVYGTIVLGCTDNTATNYNPLANTDDGTCVGGSGGSGYGSGNGISTTGDFALTGLFSTDLDSGTDTVTGLFTLAETPLGIGIVFGFIAIFLALLGMLFAFVAGMVGA